MASAKQGRGKAGKKTVGQSKAKTTADKGDANRRRFDRRDTHIVAQIEHDGALVSGMVTNLSLEGCLFAPRLEIPVGARVKLKLAGENKSVPATVKGVSDLGVHCLLHAGGATLGRLSVEVDDMALLMLNAGRPHAVPPRAVPAAKAARTKKKITKKKIIVKKKAAAAKPAATKKKAAKKAVKKPAAKTRGR
ncbi:MAG: PilZ domain-containing protein [Ferrovibrio sp.]|uniref:PilZ domain-containing protein n=1 Tax=Ferrovibrio sp. TaxID=1917215 RepID=UPI00260B24A3|nr:PilZ domain-containing protein [Ferrovibrio sp.]MCW0232993.1 PilZ domain-containing protein [Ferrovibrio sp.]